MDPFALLGLEPGADAAAIKGAYAQRLRKTRPDDDPEGFQRLHEAFQAALARAARSATWQTERRRPRLPSVANPPAPTRPPPPTPAPPPAEGNGPATHPLPARVVPLAPPPGGRRLTVPAFDGAAFVAQFRQFCAQDKPEELSRWLNTHPAFWHLPTKFAAGRLLLRSLAGSPEPMSEACFSVTSDFFHLDDALAGTDPLLLYSMHKKCTVMWYLRRNDDSALARSMFGSASTQHVHWVRTAIKRTRGPFRWWCWLLAALAIMRFVQPLAKVLLYLCDDNLAELPAPLDKERARVWIAAANPELSRTRLTLYLVRSAAAIVLIPAITVLAALVAGLATGADGVVQFALAFAGYVMAMMCAVVACCWLYIGTCLLDRKLDSLASTHRFLRIVLFCGTPALCIGALVVACAVSPAIGAVAALAVLVLAIWRNMGNHGGRRRRRIGRPQLYQIAIIAAIALGATSQLMKWAAKSHGLAQSMPTLGLIALALGIWAWDWRRRGFLAPRN